VRGAGASDAGSGTQPGGARYLTAWTGLTAHRGWRKFSPTDEGTPARPAAGVAAAQGGRRGAGWQGVLLLGSMAALPAFASDMYLPSLPDVARDLHTSVTAAQLTMTAMMIGGAVGQLVIGPVSDRFGRRRPVLLGVGLHVVMSTLCAVAPSIGLLIGLRAAQGFFNASATVIATAVIRDRFVGADAARLMSRLMLVIGAAPLFAPSIGGFFAGQWGWRSVFLVLAALGVALVGVVSARLPETLPAPMRRPGGLRTAVGGYLTLLRDRHFVGLATLPGLSFAVLTAYVVGLPFVLRNGYGLRPTQFALVFAVNGLGIVAGAQVNAALVHRVAPVKVMRTAQVLLVALCAVLFVLALTGAGGLLGLLVALLFTLSLLNPVMANATALALTRHGAVAGTAVAVSGFLQALIGASAPPEVRLFPDDGVGGVGASVAG
jgi:DHA1 family bicyclomycin/chloramphenicol resistance-like MFS transporter